MNVFCLHVYVLIHKELYHQPQEGKKSTKIRDIRIDFLMACRPIPIFTSQGIEPTCIYTCTCIYIYMYMFVSFMQLCIVYVVKKVMSFLGARSMDMARKRRRTRATNQQDDSGRM